MTDLLTALQSAERGSRPLDWSVAHKFGESYAVEACPDYTTSIDAALALVERCLPGWWPAVAQVGPGKWSADIYDPSDKRSLSPNHALTPPLALVIALMRAKEGAS